MLKEIDNLGRVVIPKSMRKELGLLPNSFVTVEKKGNTLVLSSPECIRTREEITSVYEGLKGQEENEYEKGFKDALAFVLKRESEE